MSAAEHRALRGTGLEVRSGSATSVGRVRDHNEDSLIAEGAVFAVADGMGGHAAGEVASGIAIQALATLVERPPTRPEDVAGCCVRRTTASCGRSSATRSSAGWAPPSRG